MTSAPGFFKASSNRDARLTRLTAPIASQVTLFVVTLALLVLTACGGPRVLATASHRGDESGESVMAAEAPTSNLTTARVRRGAIAETLVLQGQVASTSEVVIALPRTARIVRVLVRPGQEIQAGTPLLDVDIVASDDTPDTPSADPRNAQTTGEQQSRLQQLIEQLGRLQGQPAGFERLAAESALVLARANLQRQQAEAAKTLAGPSSAERRSAQQDLDAADAALRRAEADQERLLHDADAGTIRRAEGDIVAAENDLAKAQAAYRQIVRGPDPADIRAAERDVDQAEQTLRLAQGIKPVPLPTPTARPSGNGNREVRMEREARERVAQDANNQQLQQELAVRQAETALANARDRLARLQRGPSRSEVESAAGDVEMATRRLDETRARLASLQQRPDRLALDAAAASVAAARSNVARAEQHLTDLDAGPAPEDQTVTTAAVEGARIAVQAADARLRDVLAHEGDGAQADSDPSARDAAINAALDGPSGAALRAALQATGTQPPAGQDAPPPPMTPSPIRAQLTTPGAGLVNAVLVQTGEVAEGGQAVVRLATTGERIVRAPVPESMASRVSSGLPASVRLDDGTIVRASLGAVQDVNGTATVTVAVDWGDTHPPLGMAAQANVTLGGGPDALSVPRPAVHDEQGRRYVEVLDDIVRRVDVTTGFETETDVEVRVGLREGQLVVLPQ